MNRKHIICYGDSNTHGHDGDNGGRRFDDDVRWTMLLQKKLGDGYLICEEGLSGRTTCMDDPIKEGLNGFQTAAPIFMTHEPIDLAIIMLGTNDCKYRFSLGAWHSVEGLRRIVKKIKQLDVWNGKPKILIVAPIIIDKKIYETEFGETMGEGCAEKSEKIPMLQSKMAEEEDCYFYDCNEVVTVNTTDYMHFNRESHEKFASAIAPVVSKIFSE